MNRSAALALLLIAGAISMIAKKLGNTPSIASGTSSSEASTTRLKSAGVRSTRSKSSLDHYRAALALPFPPGVHGMIHFEKNRRVQDAISKLSPGALAKIMEEEKINLWENPESFARWGYYFLARFGELHPGESLKWAEQHFENHNRYCYYLLRGVAKTNPDQAMDLILELRKRYPYLSMNGRGSEAFGPSFQDIFREISIKNRPRAWALLQDPDLHKLRDYNAEAYVETLPRNSNWSQEIERFEAHSGDRTGWRDHLLMRWAMFDPPSAIAWKEQSFSPYQSDIGKVSRLSRVLERAAKEEPDLIRSYLANTPHNWAPREGIIEMLSRDSLYNGHDFPSLALKIETKERIAAHWIDLIRYSPPHTVPGHVFKRIHALGHLTQEDDKALSQLEQFSIK